MSGARAVLPHVLEVPGWLASRQFGSPLSGETSGTVAELRAPVLKVAYDGATTG